MSTIFSRLTPDAQSLYNRGKDSLSFLPNISSGHRTYSENVAADGKPNSAHLTGNAFDIPTRGMTSSQQEQVLDYYRDQDGVSVIDERDRAGHGPHIHVAWKGEKGGSAAMGDKDDGSEAGKKKKDQKEGDQDGNTDTKEENDKRAKTTKPVEKKKHKDIKGEPGNYQRTTTASVSSRLPTHEPWPGHPKSKEGPRNAIQGDNGGSDSGGGSGGRSGPGSSDGKGGTSSSPGSVNGDSPTSNLDKSTDPEKARAIQRTADNLGINATDLATVISYESAGTMSPSVRGGVNKDGSGAGSFVGLIQFSRDNQRKYGVTGGESFDKQMYSVENYLRDRGVKPGMGILDVYSSINAGRAGRGPGDPIYNRSDKNGTQYEHVNNMLNSGHRKRAKKIMGSLEKDRTGDDGVNRGAKDAKPFKETSSDAKDGAATSSSSSSDSSGGSGISTTPAAAPAAAAVPLPPSRPADI